MKLYVSYHPRVAVLASDPNQARLLAKVRLKERGIRCRRLFLREIDTHDARVILPPPAEIPRA
jgi:hypothetical protein